MKISLLLAIMFALAFQANIQAQNTSSTSDSGGNRNSGFKSQKTIIYPAKNGRTIDREILDWYTGFFESSPKEMKLEGEDRYIIYEIDGIKVCVGLDPASRSGSSTLLTSFQLDKTVFYWVLSSAEEVDTKYNKLQDEGNSFAGLPFFKLRKISKGKHTADNRVSANVATQEVKEFTVKDPLGNEIGVINNPIYVPTR
ncbi:hypothetical protein [Hymenobacter sediminicola]|uniref:VOC family protein n=1 Tax=Hymenobacter sediminicola TaxID=2761579 RepID=A0A7G7W8H5_9BACT|nr:hypothetical protein [Hymenobacter sediminicola]QNH62668.1 hypothetical protein H4317_02245 [Hymenobacter sediminicola]